MSEVVTLEEKVDALERRVEFLEKERPGRRMKPNVTSKPGVCGVNPEQDSATCEDASIYRYQQGCQGERCVNINREYYADYRAKRKLNTKPSGEAVVQEPEPEVDPVPQTSPEMSMAHGYRGDAVPPWASGPNEHQEVSPMR